jgi:4-aminobutyrate aminotransferase / (S)-3-amino-2-methylpropionate transaminase / 5-aminovalerate transaminase
LSRVSLKTPIPGPRSRELRAREARHLAPGSQWVWQLAGVAFEEGRGALLTDVDGNTYIDLLAGICVSSIGHGHPGYARAIAEQATRLTTGSYTTEIRARLLELVASMTPSGLDRVQLYSGGAEAVESALRLARAKTGKFEVLSFWGGFHGKTGGVLGLMGSDFKHGLGPSLPGTHCAPYPDCFRCPFGTTLDRCGLICAEFVKDKLRFETTGQLAAIILEPIQGTNGNVVPPAEFLQAMRTLAHERGALFICDEMITGFGRTGKNFGCEHFGVVPDIMTVGKGLGAGFPVTGMISSSEIVDAEPWSKPSFSSSSYGGNPLAAAAAYAAISILQGEKLVENSAKVGALLLGKLVEMKERHPLIGDVRGRGLLIGVDLVADRKTRAPLEKNRCERLYLECLRRGLLTMAYSPRFRINPPLCIDAETALEACGILDAALAAVEA